MKRLVLVLTLFLVWHVEEFPNKKWISIGDPQKIENYALESQNVLKNLEKRLNYLEKNGNMKEFRVSWIDGGCILIWAEDRIN